MSNAFHTVCRGGGYTVALSCYAPHGLRQDTRCVVDIDNDRSSMLCRVAFDVVDLLNLHRAIGEALDSLCPGLVSPLPDNEPSDRAEFVRREADNARHR